MNDKNLVPIPDYEGYSIDSETGDIFSHKSGRFLTKRANNKGYARTEICHLGRRVRLFNHITLVAVVGDCNGNTFDNATKTLRGLGKSIDHINCDKMDSTRVNLELVTHSENVRRRYDRSRDIIDL